MDRIDLLRIFIRVAESGSFTHAADTLQMPRSTVSTAVQELENRLGTRLLARTTRSVRLTDDGRMFQQTALRLLGDFEDAENRFRLHSSQTRGHVKVNLPSRIGRLIVAPALPEFLDRYPGLDVELGMTDRSINLAEDGTDCVLRVGPLQDSSLIGRKLGLLPVFNVASPSYLAQHGTPQNPADLSAHQAVLYASPTTGRIEDWEWEHDGREDSRPVRGRVTVNSAEGAVACCLAGLGVAQLPAYDVLPHIRRGELVDILPQWRAAPLPMTLLYPHRTHLSRRLEVFTEWLTGLLDAHCFPKDAES
ncbi:LysR family transcriptional regulator [Gluconobacter oxydans]|uniref:Transcriptional regluator LysR family n=2 Tax=Gluconobacter oxydans TaxID=442 RepID=Q5FT02_GLUOX|nr:LysR family transcriptional regulator [Gluconobacter oxydans]AAW60494.1 Transcriptional regluator LysR family [Gluconobacter oxydans 621H]KXV30764.1 transcriptional regulator [Gluconobacter oxydans]MBF0856677.1 LysR family transcriptional regulator [Gluconobacter oxydans]TCW25153.1 LysR family transcriptional regulator [Gluconobacter oxydans]GEC61106.1 LysR family transcriptional regulator [Gluconobacter oxydans]